MTYVYAGPKKNHVFVRGVFVVDRFYSCWLVQIVEECTILMWAFSSYLMWSCLIYFLLAGHHSSVEFSVQKPEGELGSQRPMN